MDSVFNSVFSSIDAFIYRCRNDDDYTMQFMAGGVARLLGYAPEDILENRRVSFVGLIVAEDQDKVFADVDAAIENGMPWDIVYRLTHREGHAVWVRERGSAVYENDTLTCLQGLVVSADAEIALRADLELGMKQTQAASADIAELTQNITSSVRELSMLSVNASIEAARSGEAGRGFTVVAHEIKTLANRNASWANEINTRVRDLQSGQAHLRN